VPYAIMLALVLAVATAFGAAIHRTRQSNAVNVLGTDIELSDIGSVSWEEVEILLDRLETKEPPEPVFGAMCYEAVAAPMVAEYLCPVCGEKTLYGEYNTWFIEFELQGCRRIFDEITGATELTIELDETRFCQACTPDEGDEPTLYLTLTLEDGTIISNRISELDLRMLEGFLKGRLFYYTSNDGEQPLKPHIDRIRELLGSPVPVE
jgi:hypothetical protein